MSRIAVARAFPTHLLGSGTHLFGPGAHLGAGADPIAHRLFTRLTRQQSRLISLTARAFGLDASLASHRPLPFSHDASLAGLGATALGRLALLLSGFTRNPVFDHHSIA